MLKKTRKMLLVLSAGAAMFAASPAQAGYIIIFYDDYGQVVGQWVFHDAGYVCEHWGYGTANQEYVYFQGNSC